MLTSHSFVDVNTQKYCILYVLSVTCRLQSLTVSKGCKEDENIQPSGRSFHFLFLTVAPSWIKTTIWLELFLTSQVTFQ